MRVPTTDDLDNAGRADSSGEHPSQKAPDLFTLRHLVKCFVDHLAILARAGVVEASTLRWYVDQLHHLEGLGDFPAEALRVTHLAAIKLTNGFTRALKRLYKWAADEELVPRDPFAKLTVPPCGQRTRVLSRSEVARLYLASPRPLRRLLFVQLRSIARPGEIRDLTWGQIDFARRVIVLEKFKGKKKRRDKLRARAIPLTLAVVRLLANLFRKSPDPSPAGRVFRSTRRGDPWTANGVRCAVRAARRRAGLDGGGERVVCYTLRHTGATEAIRAGVELKLVAEVMGHARTSTTERYVHLQTADVVEAIDRASARGRPSRPG